MSLATLINRECLILTRTQTGITDEYGNQILDEDAITTVCEAQPRSAVEPEDEGELSDEDWVGFFHVVDSVHLTTASAVWIPGLGEFEIVGMPANWRNPRTQAASYVAANLKRTAGSEDLIS